MSASYYRSLKVPELIELLSDDGATNLLKCNKEDLIARLLQRATHPNLNSTLLVVEAAQPEAHYPFPENGFKELKSIPKSRLSCFTIDTVESWFAGRKSLGSMKGGRKLAIRKFVKFVEVLEDGGVMFFKAVCAAQTTKSKDYTVKLVVENGKCMVQATCACCAGAGWSSACKHIAALAFNLEHFGLVGELMELISKTSKPQERSKPKGGRQVGCLKADEIAGVATNNVMRPIQTSQEEILRRLLQSFVPSSALFCPPAWHRIQEAEGTDSSLEAMTRGQANNFLWSEKRRRMLTGTVLWSVMRTVKSGKFCEGPAKRQMFPKDLSDVKPIMWGRKHEKVAIRAYEKLMGVKVVPCGLFACNELEYVGASPDGLSSDGNTVIEVKCPYSIRWQKPSTYVSRSGNITEMQYYTQVQAQMLVTSRDFCDFIVWTKQGILVQSVAFSKPFAKRLLAAAELYYYIVFLPLLQANSLV